jgi:hypothetical protein
MIWVLLVLFGCFPLKGVCQTAEATVDALTKVGFENVRWTENATERVYLLENTVYRLIGDGIKMAVAVVNKTGLPSGKACRIVVLDNNVPQLSLLRLPSDTHTKETYEHWVTSYELGDSWKDALKQPVKNSSLYKVDLVFYPELGLQNLVRTQIYQVLFNLSPAIEVSLWKGMKIHAQMILPIYHDGYPTLYKKVRPGFVGVSQTVRLPYNIWGTLTVGHFNNHRYGADLQVKQRFTGNGRFGLEGRLGYTAMGYWNGFTYHYDTEPMLTWSVGGYFYLPRYNIETTLKVEQYLFGERGVRMDVIRHFKYASVGFYVMRADNKEILTNGGFRFQVALPSYGRYKRKGHVPRIAMSPNMGMAYNATNDQFHYKSYRSAAYQNIMQNNRFNPYYIKTELETIKK